MGSVGSRPAMISLLFLSTLSLVAAGPGHHHGDGHDKNCVDISRYSEVLFNVSYNDICTYRTHRTCQINKSSACVSIPVTNCDVVGLADCRNTPFSGVYHDDVVNTHQSVPKECTQTGEETLIEYHQKPVCQNITKQQCDSKWVINSQGEKVWAGNENCQEIVWEDCSLQQVPSPITVPTYTCYDLPAISYAVAEFHTVEVTGYTSHCETKAYPVCTTTNEQRCTEVEYEECFDTIEPVCFGGDDTIPGYGLCMKIPYQTYDHRLKCIVEPSLPSIQPVKPVKPEPSIPSIQPVNPVKIQQTKVEKTESTKTEQTSEKKIVSGYQKKKNY